MSRDIILIDACTRDEDFALNAIRVSELARSILRRPGVSPMIARVIVFAENRDESGPVILEEEPLHPGQFLPASKGVSGFR